MMTAHWMIVSNQNGGERSDYYFCSKFTGHSGDKVATGNENRDSSASGTTYFPRTFS